MPERVNLAKNLCLGSSGSTGEPTVASLLNRHSMRLLSRYLSLYS